MDSSNSSTDRTHGRFDALRFGLFRDSFTRDDSGARLNSRAWNLAAEAGHAVGDCRQCGHHIFALPTEQAGRVTWYSAECRFCGKVVASPNGEVLLRSSRHDEMPAGFAASRQQSRFGA